MTEPAITLNAETNRFETVIDGITAYLSFVRLPDGNLVYDHTIVPKALGGREQVGYQVDGRRCVEEDKYVFSLHGVDYTIFRFAVVS